ncbi:MAG: hypothetical protein Q9224_006332, partial [Gallowayella concinna]
DFGNPRTKCPSFRKSTQERKKCAEYDTGAGVNKEGAFKPGGCAVYFEQYQRNEKSKNPSNTYQLAISITHNSHVQIGVATKQPVDKPLEITDSVLPYRLLVMPGFGDDDLIEFWYSD